MEEGGKRLAIAITGAAICMQLLQHSLRMEILAGVHLGGGRGGHSPPLIKSRPPLEIASLQSASHVHRSTPPLFFINTHFAPPWINF